MKAEERYQHSTTPWSDQLNMSSWFDFGQRSPCSFVLVWLISYGWKYCWLIWCERKYYSLAEKIRLISHTSPNWMLGNWTVTGLTPSFRTGARKDQWSSVDHTNNRWEGKDRPCICTLIFNLILVISQVISSIRIIDKQRQGRDI